MPESQFAAPSLFSFAVIAAFVTTTGTLLGHYLKEAILAKSFESWRQSQSIDALYKKYRDPIVLSAIELANRLNEVCSEHPAEFLALRVLSGESPLPSHNSERDHYYFRYKCQSTVYRVAAFLGWLELYRQDLVFLDVRESKANAMLQTLLTKICHDFADGTINTAIDWHIWSDALIFREEQRAVGEAMIISSNGIRTIMGYGSFVALLDNLSAVEHRWIEVVINFFIDPESNKDFRLVRYQRLLIHLVELVRILDQRRLAEQLGFSAERYLNAANSAGEDYRSNHDQKLA